MRKDYFPSLPFALDREVVGSNPVTGIKFFRWNFNWNQLSFETRWSHLQAFLSKSSFTCNLIEVPRTFLPFFLLPLQSLSKLLTPTRILRNFPIFLFYPILTRPRLDNFQFERALWVINPSILYSQLLQASSTLIVLRSSMCWIRQQLDKWSVVEPSWLLSSNW